VPAEELAHSERMRARIAVEIRTAGGWIPFDRYMQLTLYEPGLGYYASKPGKIGAQGRGDFVTAPEISPLFARALAAQVAQAFGELPHQVLEFGAGTGSLARGLIAELGRLGCAHRHYDIVEISVEMASRQRERLGGQRVRWLAAPPEGYEGVIIANEVLDVMPVKLFVKRGRNVMERGVALEQDRLQLRERAAGLELAGAVARIERKLGPLPDGYGSEIGLVARAWTSKLGT
jgi:SAM-dependent MidA family methyltransferase